MHKELARLNEIQKELKLLESISSLLQFDQETIMPPKAIEQRGEQVAHISKRSHELATSHELWNIITVLSESQNYGKLSSDDKIIVTKLRKKLGRLRKIPTEHIVSFSRLVIQANDAWKKARDKKDFAVFEPYLQKIIDMKKQEANLIDAKEKPYNVLLEDYEEGTTTNDLDKVFSVVKPAIISLLKKIKSSKIYKNQKNVFAKMDFPVEAQKQITHDIKKRMLLEDDRTMAAESVHPFSTTISKDDIRVTTAYRKGKPMFSFTSTVHECGHALYMLGYPAKLESTILFDAPSYGLHESQSRLWENNVTLSSTFWGFYYPIYQKHFKSLKYMKKDEFYALINQVNDSPIRIESNEVAYPLHVIIRYEIERALIEGTLKIKDLPKIWNAKYKEYLGIDPKNDVEGVLQDVHWSHGSLGYFPTYVLGTIYAAMQFKQMEKDIPSLHKQIQKGEFKNILAWLRENVHSKGASMLAKDIIKKACGTYVDADVYIDYLQEKYSKLYGF